MEDLGEQSQVVAPVRVQDCKGGRLLFRTVEKKSGKKGKERIHAERRRVMTEVDPFRYLYVRRLKIRNGAEHVLSLSDIEAVLLDAAGNDNEGLTKSAIAHYLRSVRPCPSTEAVIASLRSLKFLGSNIRIRPGRVTQVLVAFSGIDKRVLGDWTLELHGFPVSTDAAGRVSRVTSFSFPLKARGFRTTIERRKETTFGPWREINRTVEEIEPGA